MWIGYEKNSYVIWYCESQRERNSAHIVTHIVRRLWEGCEQRLIPLLDLKFHNKSSKMDQNGYCAIEGLKKLGWFKSSYQG